MKIVIPGNIRSKKNSKRLIHAGGRTIPISSKSYLAWEKQARNYCAGINPIPGPISVKSEIHYKGPRPDLSGALESIGDTFEGVLWENDRQIESWDGSRLVHDKTWQGVILTVEEFNA